MKALIFDVDGTLADTERDGHRIAFNLAFQELGCHWHWGPELYGQLLTVSGGKERIAFYIDTYLAQSKKRWARAFIQQLHESKTRHYAEMVVSGAIPLRPGMRRLLLEARAVGLRLAIATTTTAANVTALLKHNLGPESIGWFDIIAAGDCVPHKKPAPDIYLYALNQLGLRAAECLAFEDSHNGLQASLAAHVPTVVTVTNYTREQDFTGALTVLSDLGEPHQPAVWLQGASLTKQYVDIAQLNRWHQATAEWQKRRTGITAPHIGELRSR